MSGTPKTHRPQTFPQLLELIETFQSKSLASWYRGCSDAKHSLLPTLYRHKNKLKIDELIALETQITTRFVQRSLPFISRVLADEWDKLFFMQHYGVPTRLLDWTENPFVAVYFALVSSQVAKSVNAAIWMCDPIAWNRAALEHISFKGAILDQSSTILRPYSPGTDVKEIPMLPIMIYGSYNSPRIVAQRGGFALFGQGAQSMEEVYRTPKFPDGILEKIEIAHDKIDKIKHLCFERDLPSPLFFLILMVSQKKYGASSNFERTDKVRITNHPSKPLIWWYNRRDTIDMSPSYQRKGRLWSTSDKAYLIDSIINGFDVPKLYVADFQLGDSVLNNKKLPYAIIDGKQRFEAIFDFFEGVLVLNEDFVMRTDRSLRLGGLSLKDLKKNHAKIAEIFETETVDIMGVVTSNEEEINELFVRLNRSKPLTGAEIRNAMVGPVSDVIRNVARHSFFTDNIKFSTTRAADFNTAAKILLFEYEKKIVNTKKKDLDSFASNKKVDSSRLELAARKLLDILDDMQEIFLPRDELLSSSGPIPVYYWLVRTTPSRRQLIIREFILDFERKRKHNRAQQFQAVRKQDHDLSLYDTLNRSVNDVGSHQGRFEILQERLVNWKP